MINDFYFPKITHVYPLSKNEIDILKIVKPLDPVDWVNKYLSLPIDSSYAVHGKITLEKFQEFPVNLIKNKKLRELVICASTQFSKSFLAELMLLYRIAHDGGNYLFIYNDLQTAQDVFRNRLVPLLKGNKVLRKLLTGSADDITLELVRLNNSIIRIGSPIRRCLSSHPANLVYLSECAKYSTDFDYVQLAKSRFSQVLGQTLLLLESSPTSQDTSFYHECQRIQTHLYPFVPCTHCSQYLYMEDKLVKEIPNQNDGVFDHNYNRIRDNQDAYLECPHCQTKIYNQDKIKLLKNTIWARSSEEIRFNSGKQLTYEDESEVVLFANRLYSLKYSFSDCLADYFSALQSAECTSLESYQQEVQGRFTSKSHNTISDKYLVSLCGNYNQYDDNTRYPDDIQFSIFCFDTHDDNLRICLLGIDPINIKVYIMLEDKIEYTKETITGFDLSKKVNERIYSKDYYRQNGTIIPVLAGIGDRGGHLSGLIDSFVKYIPNVYSCFGTTSKNAPLIAKSNVNNCYALNSEANSSNVEDFLSKGNIILPQDITKDGLTELKAEYHQTKINTNGVKINEFVKLPNNHLRSAINYGFALMSLYEVFSKPDKVIGYVNSKFTTKEDITQHQQVKPKVNNNFLKNRFR